MHFFWNIFKRKRISACCIIILAVHLQGLPGSSNSDLFFHVINMYKFIFGSVIIGNVIKTKTKRKEVLTSAGLFLLVSVSHNQVPYQSSPPAHTSLGTLHVSVFRCKKFLSLLFHSLEGKKLGKRSKTYFFLSSKFFFKSRLVLGV